MKKTIRLTENDLTRIVRRVIESLNGYFGDLWRPVFKQWFKDKTDMDYKILSL